MRYLDYETLIAMHVHLMRDVMRESYYGVLSPGLLQSALARPQSAARYEGASGLRQAAYLFQGLLMNHGFAQGNKRTAFLALGWFVEANGLGRLATAHAQNVAMCMSAENEKSSIDQIEQWLVEHVK